MPGAETGRPVHHQAGARGVLTERPARTGHDDCNKRRLCRHNPWV